MMTKEAALKVAKGAAIAAAGAGLTYLLNAVPGVDLGVWTPVVVAVLSTLVNAVRKLGE
jgi:hypothetical protein